MNTITAAELGDEHLGREVVVPLIGDYGHETAAGTLDEVEFLNALGMTHLVYARVSGTVYSLRATDEVVLR